MTEAHPAHSTGGRAMMTRERHGGLGPAQWLCLAATPTFAIMALLTGLGGSPADRLFRPGTGRLCSKGENDERHQER
jgi:hypothetical protein